MIMNMEKIGNTLVVKLSGELDHHFANEIRIEVDNEIKMKKIKNLVFDFKRVTFMDSSGIGVIIGRYKQINAMGGKTLIIRACPQVDKILELSGIKKLIEIKENMGVQ